MNVLIFYIFYLCLVSIFLTSKKYWKESGKQRKGFKVKKIRCIFEDLRGDFKGLKSCLSHNMTHLKRDENPNG